jgi:glycerol-3-phosphate dehydrogenase
MYEVVIAGGGITGLATCLELLKHGYSVALYDKGELGCATSANSHHIMHGGFRYLAQLDLPRVVSSLKDLNLMLNNFPEFIVPLNCFMTLSGEKLKRKIPCKFATILYNILNLFIAEKSLKADVVDTIKEDLLKILPVNSSGILSWYDGLLLDHNGLVKKLYNEITALGGAVFSMTPISSWKRVSDKAIEVYPENGEMITAKILVTSLGPYLRNFEIPTLNNLTWVRGANIVVNCKLPKLKDYAVALGAESSAEQRMLFLVPRSDGTAVGTVYLPLNNFSLNLDFLDSEIADFLDCANKTFQWDNLTTKDIVRVESGIIPVRSMQTGVPIFYGESMIVKEANNILHIVSTKYCSFAGTARKVLNSIIKYN